VLPLVHANCFSAVVGEANFVKVKAGADEFGVRCFLSDVGSEIQPDVFNCVNESLLDQRVGVAI
jgi:hypothetical protein